MNPTAFGVLALKAAGATGGNSRSASWLRSVQNDDGGWGFAAKSASDPDSTGAVLQALGAAGSGSGVQRGVSYLRGVQRSGGGFALSGGPVNAQSTAWAAQGLLAAGISPASVRSGGTPLSYLSSTQARDGHYRYSAASDQTPVWVTGQALMAVDGAAFPLNPVPRAVSNVAGTTGGIGGIGAGGGATGGGSAGAKANGASKPAQGGSDATQAPEQDQPVPIAPASSSDSGDGGDGGVTGWLIGLGIVMLGGAIVWAGWLRYRRRLPSE